MQSLQPATRWQRVRIPLLCGLVVVIIILLGIWLAAVPSFPLWSGLNGKTAWDLAELLIVPLVLAAVAYLFSERQKRAELETAQKERENDRQIARDREEEATLQTYFDRMSDLLLNHRLREKTEEHAEERSVARALTLATLRRLNGERKGMLLQFLYESQLIGFYNSDRKQPTQTIITLNTADLTDMNLQGANLQGANLQGADLQGANLQWTNLQWANLKQTQLNGRICKGRD